MIELHVTRDGAPSEIEEAESTLFALARAQLLITGTNPADSVFFRVPRYGGALVAVFPDNESCELLACKECTWALPLSLFDGPIARCQGCGSNNVHRRYGPPITMAVDAPLEGEAS